MADAIAILSGNTAARGHFAFHQESFNACTVISGKLHGFPPNSVLRIAIHEFGNLEMDKQGKPIKLGNVFNPKDPQKQQQRAVGDLGLLQVDDNGETAYAPLGNDMVKLIGPHSIFARSLVVYSEKEKEVLACGIIGIA